MTGRIIPHANIIEIRQGDSFTIQIQLKISHQNINLYGSSINMQARDDNGNVVLSKLASEVDSANGKFALVLTPNDTNIQAGDYFTDIELSTPDGSINTIFPADVNKVGVLRITDQITR
ncbi:MAG: hypothetical protein E7019_06275 [Alphaproteobacteria bacterium]|nr:hypothetical protein [Alphaproteobacteria bacterium]